MLKIKITWPVVFMLLISLAVWLIRTSSAQPAARKPTRPTPRPATRNGHRPRAPFVIDAEPHPADCAGDSPDYAAETEALDREAADAARTAHSAYQSFYTMPKGAWQK